MPLELIKEQFETLFHSSNDSVWICDGGGQIIRCNPAAEEANQIRSDRVSGSHVSSLVERGIWDRSVTMAVLEKRRSIKFRQECRPLGLTLTTSGQPIFDDNGDIVYVLALGEMPAECQFEIRGRRSQDAAPPSGQLGLARVKRQEHPVRMIGNSPKMRRVQEVARQVAQYSSNVLINGESGTGKSLLARCIHDLSPRAEGPFVRVDCGTIADSLFEAEAFGYENGAFTDAKRSGKKGLFEQAHGGTLFLDEIASIPLGLQHKLLRFLETKEFIRVGGTKPVKIDVRLITATNIDLENEARKGRFRTDLFYRLNVVPIDIPPLRQRSNDIVSLVAHFLKTIRTNLGISKSFSPRTMEFLLAYPWPGNVRELQNLVERVVVMSPHGVIDPPDLPPEMFKDAATSQLAEKLAGRNLKQTVQEFEEQIISMALREFGTQSKAAKALGVSQATIARKLRIRQDTKQ